MSATARSMILIVCSFAIIRVRKHFDRDKADNQRSAYQRLFAKRGSRKAEAIVNEVRHRVCHDCRADQDKKTCNCEVEELLQLY